MTEGRRVLLLEDDPNLGLIIQESLTHHGFAVTLQPDGEAGMQAFMKSSFDLCLVDVMMPKKDGFTFAQEIRLIDPNVPLIFLTAKSMTEDKVAGFKIGCDDYITKPFGMEELLLRIQAVLRRDGQSGTTEDADEFDIGHYHFIVSRQLLTLNDEKRQLTTRETDLLHLLCQHRDRTLGRTTALRAIWGDDTYHAGRSMDVFISKLRKYLKDDPRIEIKTLHGQGYRLLVD